MPPTGAGPGTTSWSPTTRELDDLEVLLLGGYAPLRGFLGPEEAASVLGSGALRDGTCWPVPITLTVPAEVCRQAVDTGRLELLDEEGTPVAEMKVGDIDPDAAESCGVILAGEVTPLRRLERGSHRDLRRPARSNEEAGSPPAAPLLGVPLREPLHAPAIAALRAVARTRRAAVLLLPLTGHGSPRGLSADGLVRTTMAGAAALRADGVATEVVPVAVPDHPAHRSLDGEDLTRALDAIVARAYGATLVPGPLRADPDLPEPVELPVVVQDRRTGAWDLPAAIPEDVRTAVADVDVPGIVARSVAAGRPLAGGLTDAVTERELRRCRTGASGLTVLFTGLSGSGKSTLAKAVHAALLERTDRSVTLLDGDVVRRMLSAGLTFSRPDRELNVRRIGFVAAEITHHGGIALCAPIAPYAAVRAEVRAMVEEHGRFVLVHVSTPLATCEARDRKGLYARARRGEIPYFTGISDPYEEPHDADLAVDTTTVPLERAVEQVLDLLHLRAP